MSPGPLVSVLLTSYNREAFIAESIESVLAQTLTDFELIVSDDRSSDGTVAIANDYATARFTRSRVDQRHATWATIRTATMPRRSRAAGSSNTTTRTT